MLNGIGESTLRCDAEPTTLAIQKLVKNARQKAGYRTTVENAKLLDHGSNASAEKSVDRVRNQASTLLHALSHNIGFEVPPNNPLFSWAFIHAAWILTRV